MRLRVALLGTTLLLAACSHTTPAGSKDAGPPPIDQCLNANDIAIAYAVAATYDAGVVDAGVTDAGVTDAGVTDAGVTDAGTSDAGVTDAGVPYAAVEAITYLVTPCMTTGDCANLLLAESPDLGACLDQCLMGTSIAGLSAECTGCWVELTQCAAHNCITVCATDPYASTCSDCVTQQCVDRLGVCTGFPARAP